MSLVRMGMSVSKGYAEGHEAIFGKRERFKIVENTPKPDEPKPVSPPATEPEKSE